MVFRTQSVVTTDKMREVIHSQGYGFPYTALEADLNLFSGRCSPWHWHDCFEFATVERGSIELYTNRFRATLHTGDGYFVNASMIHLCRAAENDEFVRLHVHQFERSLFSGVAAIGRKYVAPIEDASALEAFALRGNCPEDQAILSALRNTFAAADTETRGFEMQICAQLMNAWHGLYTRVEPQLGSGSGTSRQELQRAKAMLSFIHEHYDQPITVEQVAAAAGVCERECFRCFARVMGATPKAYLAKYRIDVAARLLAETDLSITEIAYRCGFSSSSYFGKVFHQQMGCPPLQFRQNCSSSPTAE